MDDLIRRNLSPDGRTLYLSRAAIPAGRVARKHIGAHRPRSTLPGGKGSKWKRRIDGTIERRERREPNAAIP